MKIIDHYGPKDNEDYTAILEQVPLELIEQFRQWALKSKISLSLRVEQDQYSNVVKISATFGTPLYEVEGLVDWEGNSRVMLVQQIRWV